VARLLRIAGLAWAGLTLLSFLAVTVVRLETAPALDDPWEAVAGWGSPYPPFTDLGAGLLLASPAILALRLADRLEGRRRHVPRAPYRAGR